MSGQEGPEAFDESWRVLLIGRSAQGVDRMDGRARSAWNIRRVDSPEALRAHILRDRPIACVIRIDSTLVAHGDRLQAVQTEFPNIVWIGVGDTHQVDESVVRRWIVQHFDLWRPTPVLVRDLINLADGLHQMRRLRLQTDGVDSGVQDPTGLQGRSAVMRQLISTIDRVKDSDAPVLIVGETGTGKEVVARAIHRGSRRAAGPWVAVNCGAIAESLIQSELFGHEKHAFTGAMQRRAGSFESADHGSVFLDEIGELPIGLQPSLLRVLQERSVTRLGSSQPIPVDFRLIAATHVDLPAAVTSGRFREDLFFRINVLTLRVPPLREREDDVIDLAELFRERFSMDGRAGRATGYSREAKDWMRQHRWPGNVRELINRVQRAVVMAEGRWITPADLGVDNDPSGAVQPTLAQSRRRFERALVRDCLRLHGNSVSAAARELGVSRVTLYRMMEKLGLADSHRSSHVPSANGDHDMSHGEDQSIDGVGAVVSEPSKACFSR